MRCCIPITDNAQAAVKIPSSMCATGGSLPGHRASEGTECLRRHSAGHGTLLGHGSFGCFSLSIVLQEVAFLVRQYQQTLLQTFAYKGPSDPGVLVHREL